MSSEKYIGLAGSSSNALRLGHEPQIDLCVANQATAAACQLQKPIHVVATQ
jgi:hypothetical protein